MEGLECWVENLEWRVLKRGNDGRVGEWGRRALWNNWRGVKGERFIKGSWSRFRLAVRTIPNEVTLFSAVETSIRLVEIYVIRCMNSKLGPRILMELGRGWVKSMSTQTLGCTFKLAHLSKFGLHQVTLPIWEAILCKKGWKTRLRSNNSTLLMGVSWPHQHIIKFPKDTILSWAKSYVC